MNGRFNPMRIVKKYNAWMDRKHWLIQFVLMLLLVFMIRTFVFGLYWVPTGSMEPTMLVGESFFADKFTVLFTPIKRGDIISYNEPLFKYSANPAVRLFQHYVYGPDNWTKRVIGLPGDHIQGKIEAGKPVVYINGEVFQEPYVNPYPLVHVRESVHQISLSGLLSLRLFNSETNSRSRSFDPSLAISDPCQPFYHIQAEDILPHMQSPYILWPNTPAYGGVSDLYDLTLGDDEYFIMGDNRQGSFDSRGFGRIKRSLIHGRIVFRLFSFDSPNSIIYEIFTNPFGFFKKARSWNRWFCRVK